MAFDVILAQQCDDAVQDHHGKENDTDEGTICVFHMRSIAGFVMGLSIY